MSVDGRSLSMEGRLVERFASLSLWSWILVELLSFADSN